MSRPAVFFTVLCVLTLAFWPAPALAMHIPDGTLPASWAGLWFLVAAPFVFWGLRTIDRRRAAEPRFMILVALVGSAVFVVSCMPVPVPFAGSCSHPCGTGLGAMLIGPGPTVVVASIALLLQALLLSHGGLTTLGANVLSMGVVGALSGFLLFRLLRSVRVPLFVAAFFAGLISDWATYATTSLVLAAATHGNGSFWAMTAAYVVGFIPTQLPLGIAEGFLTAAAYRFVLTRRPELLGLAADGGTRLENAGATAGLSSSVAPLAACTAGQASSGTQAGDDV